MRKQTKPSATPPGCAERRCPEVSASVREAGGPGVRIAVGNHGVPIGDGLPPPLPAEARRTPGTSRGSPWRGAGLPGLSQSLGLEPPEKQC